MSNRYEIRISGTGGQGVILTGIILAEAVGRWQAGKHVVQTVSYGPQVRGGLSSAEVVIDDEEIDYPKPMGFDLLIPFTQEAAKESSEYMKKDGIIIQDPTLVQHAAMGFVANIPLTTLAIEATGRAQMANIVALGAVSVLTDILKPQALNSALKERAPAGQEKNFLKAAQAGRKAAEKVQGKMAYKEQPSPED